MAKHLAESKLKARWLPNKLDYRNETCTSNQFPEDAMNFNIPTPTYPLPPPTPTPGSAKST